MIDATEGLRLAKKFLAADHHAELPLVIDEGSIIIQDGYLIAPCNSEELIRTGNPEAMMIGCTPVKVDLKAGTCRFLSLAEVIELDV